MKLAWLLILPALAGCIDRRATTSMASPPEDLAACNETRAVPLPPPVPRTLEQLVAWARRLQATAVINAANLDDCRGRIDRLNAWLRERPAPR